MAFTKNLHSLVVLLPATPEPVACGAVDNLSRHDARLDSVDLLAIGAVGRREGRAILLLTPNAAKAITDVVADGDAARDGGLRIAATRRADDSLELALSIESAPAEGDEVVELEGARVFLEPLAAAVLEDRRLDAHVHGEQLHFEMQLQAPPGGDE